MEQLLPAFVALAAASAATIVFVFSAALSAGSDAYTKRFTANSEATLNEMLIFMPGNWLFTMKIASAALGAGVGMLLSIAMTEFYQRIVPIAMFSIPGFFLPDLIIKMAYNRRIKKFHLQMIDGLRMISNSLKAGLSFRDAIAEMVGQMDDPIRGEFTLVLRQVELGLPIERALENLSNRMPVQDLHLFVYSVNAILAIGEGLTEICEKSSKMIMERFRVETRITTLTAEGRTQSVVLCSAPYLLMGVLFFIDPALVMILFTTFQGLMILIAVILLNSLGFWVIRKITNIEV